LLPFLPSSIFVLLFSDLVSRIFSHPPKSLPNLFLVSVQLIPIRTTCFGPIGQFWGPYGGYSVAQLLCWGLIHGPLELNQAAIQWGKCPAEKNNKRKKGKKMSGVLNCVNKKSYAFSVYFRQALDFIVQLLRANTPK